MRRPDALTWSMLLAMGCLLAGYGTRGLNEPDEGRYALIALDMLEGGSSWWLPRMSDFLHLDKPPLLYWTTAWAMRLFGRSEWAVRLPSIIGAIAAVAGLGWLAWRRYGRDTAILAVTICALSLQFWAMARLLTPDMLLTGFTMLAAGAWAQSVASARASSWWLVSALLWCLAWWTKGTPALVMLGALALALLITGDARGRARLRLGPTVIVVLSLGSFWFVDLMIRLPGASEFFVGRELVGRVAGHPDGRQGPVYYYVLVSLAAWLPWWPLALWAALRRIGPQRGWQSLLQFEGSVILIGLLVFSSISSKLPSYTLPLLPWFALGTARLLLTQRAEPSWPAIRVAVVTTHVIAMIGTFALSAAINRHESEIGDTSTMRPIAAALRRAGALTAIVEHYRPGLEFYFGERVFYLRAMTPHEIEGDSGRSRVLGRSHFLSPEEFAANGPRGLGSNVWIVRDQAAPPPTVTSRWFCGQPIRAGNYVLQEICPMARTQRHQIPDATTVASAFRGQRLPSSASRPADGHPHVPDRAHTTSECDVALRRTDDRAIRRGSAAQRSTAGHRGARPAVHDRDESRCAWRIAALRHYGDPGRWPNWTAPRSLAPNRAPIAARPVTASR